MKVESFLPPTYFKNRIVNSKLLNGSIFTYMRMSGHPAHNASTTHV